MTGDKGIGDCSSSSMSNGKYGESYGLTKRRKEGIGWVKKTTMVAAVAPALPPQPLPRVVRREKEPVWGNAIPSLASYSLESLPVRSDLPVICDPGNDVKSFPLNILSVRAPLPAVFVKRSSSSRLCENEE